MLKTEKAALLIIDVQDKLFNVISQKEQMADNLQKLVKGMQILEIPVLVTEQYPQGLGSTIKEIAELLPDMHPLPKICFSCCDDETIFQELKSLNRNQILLSGIESHICVYQTAADLISNGFEVYPVYDTIFSRTEENRETGIKMMTGLGAKLTGTEAALFELLKVAKGDKFKAISRIVK